MKLSLPGEVKIIDLMMAIPTSEKSNYTGFIKPLLMDEESRQMFQMPAQYRFKDIPETGKQDDYLAYTIDETCWLFFKGLIT